MKRKAEPGDSNRPWPKEFLSLKKVHRSVCMICSLLEERTRLAKHIQRAVDNQVGTELGFDADYLSLIKALLKDDVRYEYVFPEPGQVEDVDDEELVFEFVDSKMKKTAMAKQKLIQKRFEKFEQVVEEYLSEGGTIEGLEKEAKDYIPISQLVTTVPAGTDGNVPEQTHLRERDIIEICNDHGLVEDGLLDLPVRNAQFGDELDLSPEVVKALKGSNIERLYTHQVRAIDALINQNKSVVVATPTSSGKSLIYQIPAIESMLQDPESTALYIFPTKALAQDQKRAFNKLLDEAGVEEYFCVDTYDGDTDFSERERIRNSANVIFTNPDMLHMSILPSWNTPNGWKPFLRNLKLVVVDELHVYSGWFGSNVAMVIRRLQRICERFLSNHDLKFVSCSATVRDPALLMKSLFNLNEVVVVNDDGAPAGRKRIAVCRTPFINPHDDESGRVHPVAEAAQIICKLMERGVRTIAFCKYRRSCELLMKAVREVLEQGNSYALSSKVMSYRGGYAPEDRRKIERDLFDGTLLAIVATNALELGIDIGTLEAAVIVGFPFSISNLRQQFGRAGRSKIDPTQQSVGVLVCGGDPVDQHFAANPARILELPDADIGISLNDELLVVEPHVQCAAFEAPVDLEKDAKYFGGRISEDIRKKLLRSSSHDGTYTCDDKYLPWPPKHVSIRGAEDDDYYAVVDITDNRNIVIEQIEASRVSFTLYEGGIFLHQGYPYLVTNVDLDMKMAKVRKVNVNWTTRQRDYTDVDPMETVQIHDEKPHFVAQQGKIKRTTVVFGFFKLDKSNQIIESVPVEHPPLIRTSQGLWIDLPARLFNFLKARNLSVAGAIHAACHVFISMSYTVVNGGSGMGTECKAPEKEFSSTKTQRTRPARLIFYDNHGTGVCQKAFDFVPEILTRSRIRVSQCPCTIGCPECIAMESCKEDSLVISKAGALAILNWLTGRGVSDIPHGPEPNLIGKIKHETVVPVH